MYDDRYSTRDYAKRDTLRDMDINQLRRSPVQKSYRKPDLSKYDDLLSKYDIKGCGAGAGRESSYVSSKYGTTYDNQERTDTIPYLPTKPHNKYLMSPIRQLPTDFTPRVKLPNLYRTLENPSKVTKQSNTGKPNFASRLRSILSKFSLDNIESDVRNVEVLKESAMMDKRPKRVSFELRKDIDLDDDIVDDFIRGAKTERVTRSEIRNPPSNDLGSRSRFSDDFEASDRYREESSASELLKQLSRSREENRTQSKQHSIELQQLQDQFQSSISRKVRETENELNRRIQEESSRYSHTINQLELDIRECKRNHDELETGNRELSKTVNQLQRELGNHIGSINQLETENNELSKKYNLAQQEAVNLRSDLKHTTNKLVHANTTIRKLQTLESTQLSNERSKVEELEAELDFMRKDLHEKDLEFQKLSLRTEFKSKLIEIKEAHEIENFKLSQDFLHIKTSIEKTTDEYNRFRKNVNYQVPLLENDEPDVYDKISMNVEKEIELLKKYNFEGVTFTSYYEDPKGFFTDLLFHLAEAKQLKESKVREANEKLILANSRFTDSGIDIKQTYKLYSKKHKSLLKLEKMNKLTSRLNLLLEYQEDAEVVKTFGSHETYSQLKREINVKYI